MESRVRLEGVSGTGVDDSASASSSKTSSFSRGCWFCWGDGIPDVMRRVLEDWEDPGRFKDVGTG